MAIISSHVLDSIVGDHAKGILIGCFRLEGDRKTAVFSSIANDEGRIVEEIDGHAAGDAYELVFKTADYFQSQPNTPPARQIMNEVIIRFVIPKANERIHIPLVLSPHSYTIWWSS